MKFLLPGVAVLLVAANLWFICMTWGILHIAMGLGTQLLVVALSLLIQVVVIVAICMLWRER